MMTNYDIFKDESLNCYQIRTKSHTFVVEFEESESEKIFLDIVQLTKNNPDITYKKIKEQLTGDEGKILNVLSLLKQYGLIPDAVQNGNSQEWSKYTQENKAFSLSAVNICLFGVGKLTDKIEGLLEDDYISFVQERIVNNSKDDFEGVIRETDIVIVDGTHWSPRDIERVNELALKYKKPWLYIGGAEDMSLKIGPLFYGDHTGCYNCLFSRILSNHEHPEFLHSYYKYLKDSNKSSKADLIPEEEIHLNLLANYAVLEIKRYLIGWSLPRTWRSVVKIDIYDLNVSQHKLLKKPYCEVCNPLLEYNPAPWLEAITLK